MTDRPHTSTDWPQTDAWPDTADWPNTTAWPHHELLVSDEAPSNSTSPPPAAVGPSLVEIMHGMAAFRTALLLVTWLLPLVVGVGVAGNVVSLWVLLRRGMRRTSACRYLACLAVADIVVLLVSALKTWVRVVWDWELLHVNNVTCKLVIFLTHLSLMAAAWLIVAVTLERFLAVWMPLRATQLCSVGRTRVVVGAMLVLLALINSHVFWTAQLLPVSPARSLSSSGVQCSSYAYRTLTCRVFPWVHLALYCFLPAALLLSLNSLILYKLFQHRQAIPSSQDSRSSRSSNRTTTAVVVANHAPLIPKSHTKQKSTITGGGPKSPTLTGGGGSPSSFRTSQQFHRRLAPMLLGVSFCWLVLTTPQTLYSLATPRPASMQQAATHFLVKTVCFLLMYANHALHFFLYCMSGQRFRQELRRGLVCTDSHSADRLKKGFLPKFPGHDHDPYPPSVPGDGEGAVNAVALNQPVLLNADDDDDDDDVHGSDKEFPLVELRARLQGQTNLALNGNKPQQFLRIQTPNGKHRDSLNH